MAEVGLRKHNRLFLQDVIRDNPGTAPHNALTGSKPSQVNSGSAGRQNNISNVYITGTLTDILRKTR